MEPSPMGLQKLCYVHPSGHGVFAKDDIAKRTIITTENPLLEIRSIDYSSAIYTDSQVLAAENRLLREIRHKLEALSPADLQLLMGVPHIREHGSLAEGVLHLADKLHYLDRQRGHMRLLQLFPERYYLKHSCCSNVKITSITRREVAVAGGDIQATEDIKKGEELFLPSTDEEESRYHEFYTACPCHPCSKELEAQSHERKIAQLYDQIRLCAASQPTRSLHIAEMILRLLKSQAPSVQSVIGGKVFRLAFNIAISNGDVARASIFAFRVLDRDPNQLLQPNSRQEDMNWMMMTPQASKLFRRDSSLWATDKSEAKLWKSDDHRFESWLWRRHGPSMADLKNEDLFHSFDRLPREAENDHRLLTFAADGMTREPRKHYCYLAQVDRFENVGTSIKVMTTDMSDAEVIVTITSISDEDRTRLHAGATIVILYATQEKSLESEQSASIAVTDSSTLRIFNVFVVRLLSMSRHMRGYVGCQGGRFACHGCGEEFNFATHNAMDCPDCHSFWYCSEDCANYAWHYLQHKNFCHYLEDPDVSNLFRQIGNIFEGQYLKFSLVSSQTAARLKAHTQCTDLQNGHRFPSYYNLPESRIWWPRNLDFPLFNLRQHWCLLAEVMQHFADSLCVRDKLGQQFQIGLIPGDDGRFPHVEPGWTVTVMYPTKEPMGNLVVFRKASDFKAINVRLETLIRLGDKINRHAPKRTGGKVCCGCDKIVSSFEKCRCGLFSFCTESCAQSDTVKQNHRTDCGLVQDPVILDLFVFDWDNFEGYTSYTKST